MSTDVKRDCVMAQWAYLNAAVFALRQANNVHMLDHNVELAIADAKDAIEIAHTLLRQHVMKQFRQSRSTELPKPTVSPFSPSLPPRTEISTPDRPSSLLTGAPPADDAAPQLPTAAGLSAVDAVIDEIKRDSVIVRCLLPDGTLELRLPPSLIPPELLIFGQPIAISLGQRDGIRAPVIQRRNITESVQFSDQEEIDRWIESL